MKGKVITMEKSLEKYRNEVKKRIIACAVFAVLIVVAFVVKVFVIKGIADFKQGFLFGLIPVIVLSFICLMIMDIRRLRDDEKLKAAFIAENDERSAAIRIKSGHPVVVYLSEALIVIGLAVSNETVSKTLILAALAQLIICCVLKVIYSKIM